MSYLQTADYSTLALAEAHPDRPMTLYKGPHSLFQALAPHYRLNKAEFVQMYNLRPTTQVMLELIIEEVRCPKQPRFLNNPSPCCTLKSSGFWSDLVD